MADIFKDDGLPSIVTNDTTLPAHTSGTVYDQIETSAGYFPPSTYNELLTFYTSYQSQADVVSQDFIPLTATRPNPKIFAVGIIPPSATITGNLLDRSASIGTQPGASATGGTGSAGSVTTTGSVGTGSTVRDQSIALAQKVVPSKYPDPAFNEMTGGKYNFGDGKSSSCGFLVSYGLAGIGVRDNRILNREIPEAGLKYTPGANISKIVQGGRKAGVFKTLKDGPPKPGDFVYVSDGKDGPDHNPGTEHVFVVGSVDGNKWQSYDGGNPSRDATGQVTRNINADGAYTSTGGPRQVVGYISIDALIEKGLIVAPPAPTPPATPVNWQTQGRTNANQAAVTQAQTANTSVKTGDLNTTYMAAQKAEILATQQALSLMANTPPLRMLVNPRSLKINSDKIVSDSNFTRRGPIIEHWGESQEKVEGSGKIAGFYAIDSQNPVGPGLTRSARNYSASYQNLLSLWLLYKNNAGLHVWDSTGTDTFGNVQARLSMLGSIYLFYDGVLYIGSFDSFNITEDEGAPFSLEYSFSFTVRAWFLLDRPADPRFTYNYNPSGSNPTQTATPSAPGITSAQAAAALFGR